MHGEARLLTPAGNYSVVQLPGRQFPGIVFQGDSLNNLIAELEVAWRDPDREEREAAFEMIIEGLHAVRRRYEKALGEAGISLPYTQARDGPEKR
jgi:hypothetical protein